MRATTSSPRTVRAEPPADLGDAIADDLAARDVVPSRGDAVELDHQQGAGPLRRRRRGGPERAMRARPGWAGRSWGRCRPRSAGLLACVRSVMSRQCSTTAPTSGSVAQVGDARLEVAPDAVRVRQPQEQQTGPGRPRRPAAGHRRAAASAAASSGCTASSSGRPTRSPGRQPRARLERWRGPADAELRRRAMTTASAARADQGAEVGLAAAQAGGHAPLVAGGDPAVHGGQHHSRVTAPATVTALGTEPEQVAAPDDGHRDDHRDVREQLPQLRGAAGRRRVSGCGVRHHGRRTEPGRAATARRRGGSRLTSTPPDAPRAASRTCPDPGRR